jgi:hypothetical protein
MIEQILEILFGAPENITLGIGPLALVGAGVQLFGGLMGASKARRQARAMERKQRQYQSQLENLEKNRQRIVNPYADIEDMSSAIQNPFANLQVATAAAEMQAEETDISLAGTLDTLRATGAGASGATALAQAALRSKQGIAADIQKQEMRNAELRAQGEQKMQQLRQAERARVQTLMGRGEEARMRMQEARETGRLDRLAGLADQYAAAGAQARQQSSAMLGSALGAVGGAFMSAGLSGGLGGKTNNVSNYGAGPSTFNTQYKPDDLTGFLGGLARQYGTKTGD